MTIFILLKMLTALGCMALASTIVVRDPGAKVNRLMGAILGCLGWWALAEVLWTVADSDQLALRIARSSAFGWLLVSAFAFHTFVELRGNPRSPINRIVPWTYGLSLTCATLYALTPWGLESLSPLPQGWKVTFGWLIVPGILITVVPVLLALLAWRASAPRNGSGGERRTASVVFVSLAVALLTAVMTDAVLPLFGVYPPLMGSTAVAAACGVIALHLQRYGFSLLSADAFAEEIIGSLPDGVMLVRRDGSVRYANTILAELACIDEADARRCTIGDLLPELPDNLEDVAAGTETVLRRSNGTRLPVVVSPVAVTHERRDIVGFALIVRDRRDVVGLRDRLVRSTRLAAVGDLSAGIAREIMRPMLEVRTSLADLKLHWQVLTLDIEKAGLAAESEDIVTEGNDLIDESLEGVDRVTQLVRNVQGFSLESSSRRSTADVNEIVEHSLRVALSGVGPGVRLETDLAAGLPPVACRQNELEQVVVNLVVNAFQAVQGSGCVRVETIPRTGGVLVRISDDGCGIPEAMLDRIFDPFFTTKPVGEGTGLGLAICYHIVRNHGGTLSVESGRGLGTTFTVDLPAA
jgi:signal transduction histidine kinase